MSSPGQLARSHLEQHGWVIVENVLSEAEIKDAATRIVGLLPAGGSPNDAYGKMEAEDGRHHEPNGRLPLDASVCDGSLANLPCAPAVVAAVSAVLGAPQAEVRLNNTSVAVATWLSEPGGERVDDNHEGFHVDWPQAVKRLLDTVFAPKILRFQFKNARKTWKLPLISSLCRLKDRSWHQEQPSTIAECLASAAGTLSGVLSCSAVSTRGGAFMVRSGSHAVVRRHLETGDNDTLERLLAQDLSVLEPELEPPTEMCVPAGSCIFYHPFLVHDRSENFLPEPRLVLFAHYRLSSVPAEIGDATPFFHGDHLAAMDGRERAVCGLGRGGGGPRL